MARVSITIDHIAGLRIDATNSINNSFESFARNNISRDTSHMHKRATAAAVAGGRAAPAEFAAEAALRGVTTAALCALILAKPDTIGQRELARQTALLKIAAATTPDEIAQIVANPLD